MGVNTEMCFLGRAIRLGVYNGTKHGNSIDDLEMLAVWEFTATENSIGSSSRPFLLFEENVCLIDSAKIAIWLVF